MSFQMSNPNIKHVRILLAGEVGAGKSSFINSLNSAFQGRITGDALVDATTGTTFTKTVRTYCSHIRLQCVRLHGQNKSFKNLLM